MPETKTITNDPAAVLRALADGHRVRFEMWGDAEFLHLHDVSVCRNYCGEQVWRLTGTWHVLPKRDMGADPRAGDVYSAPNNRGLRRVIAVTDNNVFVEHDGPTWLGWASRRDSWSGYFASGKFVPVEYAND